MFHFKNGGHLPITFSSFLMKLFLLPTERNNKILKSKYFDQRVCSVSTDASVVCRPTRRSCVGRCVGSVLADASIVCWWCLDRRVGGIGFLTFTQTAAAFGQFVVLYE